MTEKRSIRVRAQFEGFHCWSDAPDEVAFLREEHRHIFHVDALIEVRHGDRELEFILVKRWLERESIDPLKLVLRQGLQTEMSCEDIAELIAGDIRKQYGNRAIKVEVSEDGENGGIYKWTA